MTAGASARPVARVGDTLALTVLVVLALALIRAIATGQGLQWLRAKFTNREPGEPSVAPSGFVTGTETLGVTAGEVGALLDPCSGFGTSPAPASCFGSGRDNGTRAHEGLDINVPVGWPVAAPAAGVASIAGMGSADCGLSLTIDHGSGLTTHYCHLSGLAVAQGAHVYRGQVVAKSGGRPGAYGAGNSAAPHLHFAVYRNGVAVDPAPLIGRRCG